MENSNKKTSQDVIAGLKIEGHKPTEEKKIVDHQPEINSAKDLDEEVHSEINQPVKENEERDNDNEVHENENGNYNEDEEQDVDDMLHEKYKGIY